MLVVWAPGASAQTTAVCSNTPGSGERIECTESSTSSNDIDIDAEGVDIDTATDEETGIYAHHEGNANIDMDVGPGISGLQVTRSAIDTTGLSALGIRAEHDGTGDIDIDIESADITTTGSFSYTVEARHDGIGKIRVGVHDSTIMSNGRGVYAWHTGTATGDIVMIVSGSTIETQNRNDYGVFVQHGGENSDPNTPTHINLDVRSSVITTNDYGAHGVRGYREYGAGNVDIDVRDTTINTMGDLARGIDGYHINIGDIRIFVEDTHITTMGEERAPGIRARLQDLTSDTLDTAGDIHLTIRGGSITTHGAAARIANSDAGLGNTASGIEAFHSGITGDITIDVQDLAITTEGTVIHTDQIGTLAHGIYALYQGTGNIDIDARGGSITTKGSYSYGIFATHSFGNAEVGDGHITIDTLDGHTITTTGDNAHGIVAYHYGDEDSRSIAITVGGSVDAGGANADGVRVGIVNDDGEPERIAGIDEDGFRRQTVRVNGRVQGGTGQGAGIFLAGGGKVFIGPQGTVGAESDIAIRASGGDAPRLLVDMTLDGRRVAQVIGDGWIVNDGGETTIVVNGVLLHDGATGVVPGASAPNGAFGVSIREDGVTVDTGTDPWTISERSTGVIADRDFNAEDFESAEAEGLGFVEEYAPRAAVYEALPGVLLRLNGRGRANGKRMRSPDTPVWIWLDRGAGSYEAERATVGAAHDVDRFAMEIGTDFRLANELTGSIGARLVAGSVDVSAPTGGGTIEASGHGLSLGLAWQGANGVYANGRASATWYDLDMTSDRWDILKTDVGAVVRSLDLEAGRQLAMDEGTTLTARTWLSGADVSVDDFTDAVRSRFSLKEADRLIAGVGGVVETDMVLNGGEQALSLRGSIGLEQTLAGRETVVLVSGEELKSKAPGTRVLVGVGGTWRSGRYTLDGTIRAGGVGSGDTAYTGTVSLRMAF